MDRSKCEKIETAMPPHLSLGGVGVMTWVCMAASGVISLEFIDNFTADSSSRMNVEV